MSAPVSLHGEQHGNRPVPFPKDPVGAQPHAGASTNTLDLSDVVGVLRRRKAVIMTTAAVVTCAVALVVFQLTPRYTATSEVMIIPGESQVIDLGEVGRAPPTDEVMLETQMKVLVSRANVQRTVEELGLLSDPEFNAALRPAGEGSFLAAVGGWLSAQWVAATSVAQQSETPGLDEDEPQLDGVAERFLDQLRVSQSGRSYILSVDFTSVDAEKAARVANAVAAFYVERQLEDKLAATSRNGQWLADRAEELRKQVIASEKAVEEYRATNELANTPLDAQQLTSFNVELINARTELNEKQARLAQVRALSKSGQGYSSVTEVMSSPTIHELRRQEAELVREEALLSNEYGERHPKMIQLKAEQSDLAAKIEEEIRSVIRNLENEFALARNRAEALLASFREAKERSSEAEGASVQLRQLEREAEANRSLYETFLTRLKQTEQQQGILQPDAKVISMASVPLEPSFPKKKLMLGVGFTGSLMLGGLIAFMIEYFDRSLRTGRQLEDVIGIPSIGHVPSIRRRKGQKVHHYLLEKPLSAYAEAILAIRKAVQLSNDARAPKFVLVTSTLPGEGKTVLAVSLAASAARSGLKTVVVDLDLRHPSVAREMETAPDADLAKFMAGEATLREITYTDELEPKLHFIPVKRVTSSPVDMLESQKMASLMAELRRTYDYIVLDTTPAVGLYDAKIAAGFADAVLLAVRWEKTTAELVLHGVESLAAGRVTPVGAVLTRVDVKRHANYAYGDSAQHYKQYEQYYIN
jgi:capsular exopolysaccharide synthesis family protein